MSVEKRKVIEPAKEAHSRGGARARGQACPLSSDLPTSTTGLGDGGKPVQG